MHGRGAWEMSGRLRPPIRVVRVRSKYPSRYIPRPPRVVVVPSPKIAALLEEPTWSVKSLLPTATAGSQEAVTPKQLHHLLRLSALPPPGDEKEEAQMLQTLQSQIHFVKEIQKVDTSGVEPLRAIREETAEAIEEQTIKLSDLKEHLDAEVVVGRNGRIRRMATDDPEARAAEDWDPFSMSDGKRVGRYFYVKREKTPQTSGEEVQPQQTNSA